VQPAAQPVLSADPPRGYWYSAGTVPGGWSATPQPLVIASHSNPQSHRHRVLTIVTHIVAERAQKVREDRPIKIVPSKRSVPRIRVVHAIDASVIVLHFPH
jgi:hypothetical protein